MPQLLLQGFPDGAIRIGATLSVLKKEGTVTYFVGPDNFYSHPESDGGAQRFALATLIANGHVRPSEVERSSLGIPHRTLMNWTGQLATRGAGSFFEPHGRRGETVLTTEKAAECGRLLDQGESIATVARLAQVGESTLRKAVKAGRVVRATVGEGESAGRPAQATDKSERSRSDARAAEGMGTACTRADERMAAALGLIVSARTRFERCRDVAMGGVHRGPAPETTPDTEKSGLGRPARQRTAEPVATSGQAVHRHRQDDRLPRRNRVGRPAAATHLAKEEEARALIRELFVSAADLDPNEQDNTLTVRIHRMACPAHDKAITALLTDLTQTAFRHPETGMRLIYELA